MAAFVEEYGTNECYDDFMGELMTKDETHESVTKYIESLNLQDYIQPAYRTGAVARTSVTHETKACGPGSVNIKLPVSYRTGEVQGVWDHEIGTHFLRRFNERFQPWAGNKYAKFGIERDLKTEEGVASVNQLVRGVSSPFISDLYSFFV